MAKKQEAAAALKIVHMMRKKEENQIQKADFPPCTARTHCTS